MDAYDRLFAWGLDRFCSGHETRHKQGWDCIQTHCLPVYTAKQITLRCDSAVLFTTLRRRRLNTHDHEHRFKNLSVRGNDSNAVKVRIHHSCRWAKPELHLDFTHRHGERAIPFGPRDTQQRRRFTAEGTAILLRPRLPSRIPQPSAHKA